MIVTAYKNSKTTHVGIRMWATPDRQQVVIVHLDDHSIFSQSGLKIGMKLDRINETNCSGKTPDEISSILNDAVGRIALVASAPGRPSSLVVPEVEESDCSEDEQDEPLVETKQQIKECEVDFQHLMTAPFLGTFVDFSF